MPCPFFEPITVIARATFPNARLPLLEEYDGLCHANKETQPVPRDLRFACCNHGYSRGSCPHFPLSEVRSAVRFDVRNCGRETMELLVVEERDHFPIKWTVVRYRLATNEFEPQIADHVAQAQLLAFCRSFLRKYSA